MQRKWNKRKRLEKHLQPHTQGSPSHNSQKNMQQAMGAERKHSHIWYTYTSKKKKETQSSMAAGLELEIIGLQRMSQTRTSQYHTIPSTCGLSESIATETESNGHQRPGWGGDLSSEGVMWQLDWSKGFWVTATCMPKGYRKGFWKVSNTKKWCVLERKSIQPDLNIT